MGREVENPTLTMIPYATEKCWYNPSLGHADDAGWDLQAAEDCTIQPLSFETVSLGIRVDIPQGYFGLLCSRSGMACDGIGLVNGIGIIDSGYTGTIKVTLFNYGRDAYEISRGDRVAQLIIMPYGCFSFEHLYGDKYELFHSLPCMHEVSSGYFESLSEKSDRGNRGFGSTGKSVWDEIRRKSQDVTGA